MKTPAKPHPFKSLTRIFTVATVLAAATSTFAAEAPAPTDEQKTLYAVGVSVARSLAVFDLSPAEFEYVKQGLIEAQNGKVNNFELASLQGKIQELARSRRKATGEKQAGAGKDFLERAAKEKGAVKTASGMVYSSLAEGKGATPKADDVVKVHYRGTLVDGKEFDSSFKRGRPIEFKLDNVIKCWTEGVQMMKPGGKARLVCPPQLAYGDNGAGEQILPGATLAFEVELLEVTQLPAATPGSSAAAAPAAAAKK
ncbi:MAG: peptidylprolyl isomerase [Geobacteraceae bacterium GWC2_58_44]|nr:MAG: peptidylprolyl isomerase [Geobacteraceae bacterium GWC2_58_44]HBG05631.1 peptidylprolyl isomerase [Geobacter sp.]